MLHRALGRLQIERQFLLATVEEIKPRDCHPNNSRQQHRWWLLQAGVWASQQEQVHAVPLQRLHPRCPAQACHLCRIGDHQPGGEPQGSAVQANWWFGLVLHSDEGDAAILPRRDRIDPCAVLHFSEVGDPGHPWYALASFIVGATRSSWGARPDIRGDEATQRQRPGQGQGHRETNIHNNNDLFVFCKI